MRFASILFLFALCAIELHAQGCDSFREIGKEAGVTKVPFSSKNQHYVVETIWWGGAFRLATIVASWTFSS